MAVAPLVLISALLHALRGLARAAGAARRARLGRGRLALMLAASALLMPLALLARRVRSPRGADALAWAGMLCMGLFSSLFVLTLARDAVLLLAAIADVVMRYCP